VKRSNPVQQNQEKSAVIPTVKKSAVIPTVNGWVVADYSHQTTNGYGYDWYNATYAYWNVPQAPSSYVGQTIFLFNGLMREDWQELIQPVLQYGPSAAGGGNYWAMAVWYIDSSGNATHSTIASLQVNALMLGDMYPTDPNSSCPTDGRCEWNIAAWSGGVGRVITVTPAERMRYALKGVLEAYNITNCNQYPNQTSTEFDSGDLDEPGPNPNNYTNVLTSETWATASWNVSPNCSATITDGSGFATITY
jgi:hypothetical protein